MVIFGKPHSLLQLSDASQCCPLLLSGGDAPVAAMSSELIIQMLHAVGLSLRPHLALNNKAHVI